MNSAFHHVRWAMPSNKIVFLIYASGRVVILGSVSTTQLTEAITWLAKELSSPILQMPLISNVVACMNLGKQSQLADLAQRLAENGADVSYEPELAPGIILRQSDPKSTTMLFHSGKATVTGIKDITTLERVAEQIKSTVNACRHRCFAEQR